MTGLERNADVVSLACYAPLFCNKEYVNWKPDMIWFDHREMVRSTSYHVQHMFMTHQGTHALPAVYETASRAHREKLPDIQGRFGFASENPTVLIERVCVNGEEIDRDGVLSYVKRGKKLSYTGKGASIVQLENKNAHAALYDLLAGEDAVITFDFVKKAGKGQLRFYFGYQDGAYYQWEIGGWANDMSSLGKSDGKRYSNMNIGHEITVKKQVHYHAELRISGRRITALVNGEEFHDFTEKETVVQPLYYTASEDSEHVYLKVVNVTKQKADVRIALKSADTYRRAEIIRLRNGRLNAENTFSHPDQTAPVTEQRAVEENSLQLEIPSVSVQVITFQK